MNRCITHRKSDRNALFHTMIASHCKLSPARSRSLGRTHMSCACPHFMHASIPYATQQTLGWFFDNSFGPVTSRHVRCHRADSNFTPEGAPSLSSTALLAVFTLDHLLTMTSPMATIMATSSPIQAPLAGLPFTMAMTTSPTLKTPSLFESIFLGGTACVFTVNFTHPIELIKTRMQVSGDGIGITVSQVRHCWWQRRANVF